MAMVGQQADSQPNSVGLVRQLAAV